MGKYNNDNNDQNTVQLNNIANELAEINRLKRIEIKHNKNIKMNDVQYEQLLMDKA